MSNDKEVVKKKVLYFTATWCGPCKVFSPILETVVKEVSIDYEKIDIDNDSKLAMQYEVRAVPTVVVVDQVSGKEVARNVGLISKDKVKALIEK